MWSQNKALTNSFGTSQFPSGGDELKTNPLSGKAALIFEQMERRLMSGHYRFGDTISIVELAAEFNSSRQPVTVAINHLRSLGYLIILPQVGCKVVTPTAQDIMDLFLMLSKVEGLIAGMAAQRHQDAEIIQLEQIADYIENIDHKKENHTLELAQSVDAFHDTIRKMAHSNILESKAESLWRLSNFMMWQGVTSLSASDVNEANKERRKILNFIKSKDSVKAEKEMEKHIIGKPRRVGIA